MEKYTCEICSGDVCINKLKTGAFSTLCFDDKYKIIVMGRCVRDLDLTQKKLQPYMALRDAEQHWTDDERYYAYSSERDSDDSPIFRNEKRRYGPAKVYGRTHRRATFSILAKFFLVCSAMILFCCLLYVPVFMRVDRHVVRAVLDGWSMDTNRDTSLYVRPHNKTTIYEPDDVCPKTGRERDKRNRLFLLVIVCSSTNNFHRRAAIRNTWGDYKKYLKLSKVFHDVREKYKNYNFSYPLFPELESNVTKVAPTRRVKRDISSFNDLLPELAKALEKRVLQKAETVEVPDKKEEMLHQFDMNKELGDNDINNDLIEDYEYADNIMKIPRKGENISNNFESLIVDYLLKQSKDTDSFVENLEAGNTELDYKLVFLLGLPTQKDAEEVQSRIDSEVNEYNDIIQEDFLDTYNNLTLKSIMMLKWVTNNCQDAVRYILKTDDDVYVNVPHLMMNLRNRSQVFDNQTLATGKAREEHLLIGDLICGARPVLDSRDKWYSPRYMFSGKKYPHYLSGSAYALTAAAGAVLYRAALTTRYFHLEDIFITGMVPKRTQPPLAPTEDTMFTFSRARGACGPHIFATTHRIEAQQMQRIVKRLLSRAAVEFCEKERLTQVRKQIEKQKQKTKTAPGVKYHTRTVIMN